MVVSWIDLSPGGIKFYLISLFESRDVIRNELLLLCIVAAGRVSLAHAMTDEIRPRRAGIALRWIW